MSFSSSKSALGPRSHSMGNAFNAVLACHQVSATTATPLVPTAVSTFTTPRTPGMPSTAFASKLFNLPPNTGASLMLASNMPSSWMSAPYFNSPVSFSLVSRRFTGLPAIFHSDTSFSGTSVGGVNLLAASATLPNVVCLLEPR